MLYQAVWSPEIEARRDECGARKILSHAYKTISRQQRARTTPESESDATEAEKAEAGRAADDRLWPIRSSAGEAAYRCRRIFEF